MALTATLRIAASLLPAHTISLLWLGGAAWIVAFGLLSMRYGAMALSARGT